MAAAVVGAPGYAPRADHGNPGATEYLINPLAQLDAHKRGALSSTHNAPPLSRSPQ